MELELKKDYKLDFESDDDDLMGPRRRPRRCIKNE